MSSEIQWNHFGAFQACAKALGHDFRAVMTKNGKQNCRDSFSLATVQLNLSFTFSVKTERVSSRFAFKFSSVYATYLIVY